MTVFWPLPCNVVNALQEHLRVKFTLANLCHQEIMNTDLTGQTSLIFVPPQQLLDTVKYYSECKKKDGLNTSAVFVTPKHDMFKGRPAPLWYDYIRHMTLVTEYAAGTIMAEKGSNSCVIPWKLQVWFDPQYPPPPKEFPHQELTCSLNAVQQGLEHASMESMFFHAKISGTKAIVLIDSGASANFVSEEFVKNNGLSAGLVKNCTVKLAGNQDYSVLGKANMSLAMGKHVSHAVEAYILPELISGVSLILGVEWMKKYRVDLLFSKGHCTVQTSRHGTVVIQPMTQAEFARETRKDEGDHETSQNCELHMNTDNGFRAAVPVPPPLSAKQAKRALKRGARPHIFSIRQVFGESTVEHEVAVTPSTLQVTVSAAQTNPVVEHEHEQEHELLGAPGKKNNDNQEWEAVEAKLYPNEPDVTLMCRGRLKKLLERFRVLFPDKLPAFVPKDFGVEHRIHLKPDAKIPYKKPYRMSPKELEEAKRQIVEFLEKGIVVPSHSPFGAQVFFVTKPDGSLRMVSDYRALNSITFANGAPIPNIQDLIDKLQGKKIFSSIDLFSGFYQVGLHPDDRHKSAIVLPFGQFEFTCLSLGMCGSPSTFQAVMNKVFEGLDFVVVYIDDVVIASEDPETHERHLAEVFERLEKYKLYCNLKKCAFNRPELKFLGHICGRDGVKVDPAKIKVVQEWPQPRNVKEVQQWLGLTNYFRKFIQGYASLVAPLHTLTHKNTVFEWKDEHTAIFEELKYALTHAPVLAMPDFSKQFEVVSDASLLGTGAVLMQDGRPVAYHSKKFTPAERNYTTGEQELLGVIHALDVWRCYLEGVEFKVITDHHPLTYLDTQPMLSRRQARWVEKLSRFTYQWHYRPGRINVADPLSRNPQLALVMIACAMSLRSRKPSTVAHQQVQKKQRTKRAKNGAGSSSDVTLMSRIKEGYAHDPFFANADDLLKLKWQRKDGFWICENRIVVPDADDLRQEIIVEMHEPPMSGHVGTEKTFEAVRRTFFWKTMRKDVNDFVRKCHQCQVNKSSNQKPGGLLTPLAIPERRWEVVTMDLITSLPMTQSGHDAIVVFVDKLSKMVHFAACKTAIGAEEFAALYVKEIVRYHGVSKVLISDRDPRFTGKFLTTVCNMLGVKQGLSTAFHPQTDGQTEIMNRYLQDMLRHYVSPRQDDWDEKLAAAEFAVNNSWHSTLKNTPFFLNYGQHPLTPVTLGSQSVVPSATAFVHDLESHIKAAKVCLKAAQDRQKTYADTKRREVTFSVGDMVLLSTRNIRLKKSDDMAKKLMPKWIGPLKVLDCVGPVAVRLELPPHLKMHNVFHVSLVKPYHDSGKRVPLPPMDYIDDEPIFKVEMLLDSRIKKRGSRRTTEYLVRWEGYSPIHDSWEPASNILDKSLITEFKSRQELLAS